jgi:hypothetical protein
MVKLTTLLLVVAVLGAVQNAAQANDSACRFVEWGYGYMKIEDRGEEWTYAVEVPGPTWRMQGYGYHAPGWLSCENCSSASTGAGGLYHFIALATAAPFKPIATAAERAARRTEEFGYPPVTLGPDQLDPSDSREGLSLGPLSGYAVSYKLAAKEPGKNRWADILASRGGELLVIHLTDGCVSFETTILSESSAGANALTPLDSFLTGVVIKKVRTSDFKRLPVPPGPYSAIVRAPRQAAPSERK